MKEFYFCSVCKTLKARHSFYIFKNKINGKTCKSCRKTAAKETYYNNKAKKKTPISNKKCVVCKIEKDICKYDKNKSRPDLHTTQCKDCINKKRRARYAILTSEEIATKNHKQKSYNRNYRKTRRQQDPCFKLRERVSQSVWVALKRNSGNKCGSTFKHLPYTPRQLKEHLESQFEDWMTWDNWGEWHIDHITPQSALPYDSLNHPNFLKAWDLKNLRPLSATQNFKKGSKILSICI